MFLLHLFKYLQQNLPELNATLVHLLQEIGDGVFGKVYKGRILPNSDFNPNYPVSYLKVFILFI